MHFIRSTTLGTTYSLTKDGSFDPGLEAALVSTSVYDYRNIKPLRKWFSKHSKLLGRVELVYSEIGSIDNEETENQEEIQTNPFAVGGGYFRLNTSIDPYYSRANSTEGIGLRIGAGYSTQPVTETENIDTRGRIFGGLVFRANYGNDKFGRKGKGELFIGY